MSRLSPNIQRALDANRETRGAQTAPAAVNDNERQRQELRRRLPTLITDARAVAALAIGKGVAPLNGICVPEKKLRQAPTRRTVLRGWNLASTFVTSLPYNRGAVPDGERSYRNLGVGTENLLRILILGTDTQLHLVDAPNAFVNISDRGHTYQTQKERYRGTGLSPYDVDISAHSTLGAGNPQNVTTLTPDAYLAGFDADRIETALVDIIRVEHLTGGAPNSGRSAVPTFDELFPNVYGA